MSMYDFFRFVAFLFLNDMFRTITWLIFSSTKKWKGQIANLIRGCHCRTWQQVGDEGKVPLEQNWRCIFQRCAKTDIATRKQIKSILIDCRTSILACNSIHFPDRTFVEGNNCLPLGRIIAALENKRRSTKSRWMKAHIAIDQKINTMLIDTKRAMSKDKWQHL